MKNRKKLILIEALGTRSKEILTNYCLGLPSHDSDPGCSGWIIFQNQPHMFIHRHPMGSVLCLYPDGLGTLSVS